MKTQHSWIEKVRESFIDYYWAIRKAQDKVDTCELGTTICRKFEPEWNKMEIDVAELHRCALTVAMMLVEHEDGGINKYNFSVTPMCLKYEGVRACPFRGKGKFKRDYCTPCLLDPHRVTPLMRLRNAVESYNKLYETVGMEIASR